jgi:hypothetical protein
MAPRRSHRSTVRGIVAGAVLTGAIALSVTSGGQFVGSLTGSTVSKPAVAPVIASGLTVRGSVLGRSEPYPTATPEPTPAPTAAPTAAPAPAAPAPAHVAAAPARKAAPPPVAPRPASYRNRLVSADGSLNVFVGYYSDCSGRTALTRAYVAIDTCVGGRTYFVGHNPGPFTPLFHMGVGTVITWWDGAGNAHPLRIIAVRALAHSGVPSLVGGAVAQFQTCIDAAGTVNRITDLAPA